MPTAEQHRQQAEHTALHLVEWFLKTRGLAGRRDHHLHDAYIARMSELRSIYFDYTELKFQSEAGRYECAAFSPDFLRNDLLPRLAQIETHIKALLSEMP